MADEQLNREDGGGSDGASGGGPEADEEDDDGWDDFEMQDAVVTHVAPPSDGEVEQEGEGGEQRPRLQEAEGLGEEEEVVVFDEAGATVGDKEEGLRFFRFENISSMLTTIHQTNRFVRRRCEWTHQLR